MVNLKDITIKDLLDRHEISTRTSNCCFNAKFNSVFDIVAYNETGRTFLRIKNAGKRTRFELQAVCSKYSTPNSTPIEVTVEAGLEKEKEKMQGRQEEIRKCIETDCVQAINHKLITVQDVMDYLTSKQKAILEAKYNKLITNYSIRTTNRLQSVGFERFVTSYLFESDRTLMNIKNLGKKSVGEAVDLKNKIKREFSNLINLPDEDLICLEQVYQKGEVAQNSFVLAFHKQNHHLPLFWILEQYLLTDSNRRIAVLTSTFNIFQNREVISMEEVAAKQAITRERVRQIRNDVFLKTFAITDAVIEYGKRYRDLIKYNQLLQNKNDWHYIEALSTQISLHTASAELPELLQKEQSKLSIEFVLHIIAYLYRDTFSVFGGIEVLNKDKIWENTFLIQKEFTAVFDFEKFREKFKNHLINNDTEYDMHIAHYVTTSACWTHGIDLRKRDNISRIVTDILVHEFGLHPNADGSITIRAMKDRNLFFALFGAM